MQGCLREMHFLVLRVLGLFESKASRPHISSMALGHPLSYPLPQSLHSAKR